MVSAAKITRVRRVVIARPLLTISCLFSRKNFDLESTLVHRSFLLLALAAFAFTPLVAHAAMVAANSIPDGTYTVKVVKVVDPKHVDVTLDNGQEALLPAGRANVDFSKVQANDQIKLSLIGGNVMVYMDLTSH